MTSLSFMVEEYRENYQPKSLSQWRFSHMPKARCEVVCLNVRNLDSLYLVGYWFIAIKSYLPMYN